eukprot:SAG11_NODE_5201_length_1632_cov_1.174821_1_plen_92_part_00
MEKKMQRSTPGVLLWHNQDGQLPVELTADESGGPKSWKGGEPRSASPPKLGQCFGLTLTNASAPVAPWQCREHASTVAPSVTPESLRSGAE